jgi:D-cysteine desulfhydrase
MKSFAHVFDRVPRLRLAHLPTPVEELPALSRLLGGPRLLIKRDDQTGLGLGGNKARKLEFLIADALTQKATTIVTAGAAQSNHCRQTAAAAARVGLECELVLGGAEQKQPTGNLLLDYLFGATVHWTGMERRGERMREIAVELERNGKKPYLIPYGGSNAVGTAGYALAMVELMEQLERERLTVDRIVFASSSGGTQAGIAVGARAAGYAGGLIGISIDKGEREPAPFEEELSSLSNATAVRLGLPASFMPRDFAVRYEFLGGGYGVMGDSERDAIRLLAKHEGLLLDPVYTGRAMGALLSMIRSGEIPARETVLFWHTGGAPALFAYATDLRPPGAAVR